MYEKVREYHVSIVNTFNHLCYVTCAHALISTTFCYKSAPSLIQSFIFIQMSSSVCFEFRCIFYACNNQR